MELGSAYLVPQLVSEDTFVRRIKHNLPDGRVVKNFFYSRAGFALQLAAGGVKGLGDEHVFVLGKEEQISRSICRIGISGDDEFV